MSVSRPRSRSFAISSIGRWRSALSRSAAIYRCRDCHISSASRSGFRYGNSTKYSGWRKRGAGWHLRAGLAALQLRKYDVARAELDAIREPELPPPDYPWYWFFEGAVLEVGANIDLVLFVLSALFGFFRGRRTLP